jgi:hypothetical protein
MATRETITEKILGTGSNWYEPISTDYLKDGGTGHGPGILLIYGHTRMSLPTPGKRLAY